MKAPPQAARAEGRRSWKHGKSLNISEKLERAEYDAAFEALRGFFAASGPLAQGVSSKDFLFFFPEFGNQWKHLRHCKIRTQAAALSKRVEHPSRCEKHSASMAGRVFSVRRLQAVYMIWLSDEVYLLCLELLFLSQKDWYTYSYMLLYMTHFWEGGSWIIIHKFCCARSAALMSWSLCLYEGLHSTLCSLIVNLWIPSIHAFILDFNGLMWCVCT